MVLGQETKILKSTTKTHYSQVNKQIFFLKRSYVDLVSTLTLSAICYVTFGKILNSSRPEFPYIKLKLKLKLKQALSSTKMST